MRTTNLLPKKWLVVGTTHDGRRVVLWQASSPQAAQKAQDRLQLCEGYRRLVIEPAQRR